MPGHSVHIQLAATLLQRSDEWSPPEWTDSPDAVNALFHGAIGPDMGFFPGADALLGGLAHYLRPGVLAMELVRGAETDVQQAYAWGWVTHLLGDVHAHMRVVNNRAGEIIYGSADRPAPYAESAGAHLSVEVGLDAQRLAKKGGENLVRLTPFLDEESSSFIRDAIRATYDIDFAPRELVKSHEAVSRFQPVIFRLVGMLGRRVQGVPLSWAERPLIPVMELVRLIARLGPRSSRLYGVTHPDRAPAWVIAEMETIVSHFPAIFATTLKSGLSEYREINVDTGELDGFSSTYPYAVWTRKRLLRKRKTA